MASSSSAAAATMTAYKGYEHFIITSPRPGVAHVEINRPRKLNAFHEAAWLEFGRVFDQLSGDAGVRAVVLSGSGDRAFTAGLDVQDAAGSDMFADKGDGAPADAARRAKVLRAHIEDFQRSIAAMEKCEKPVICVMHGISIGLAIDIACCADIRIATPDVRFAVKEVDIGIPADIGTLARLPKIVGSSSWVKDVCMTARDFGADEALSVGFVSRVVREGGKPGAVEAGLELAATLAGKSPVAVQGTKELLNYGREHGTAEALRYTAVWNSVAVQSEDFLKALQSGLRKTTPKFSKL